MRRKATFEDRFDELLAEATPEQLTYMLGVLSLQVRLAERKKEVGK
jgi:hypothetical protein